MAAGGGGGAATTGWLIVRAQKSTNQLKALLAKLLPAGGAAQGAAAVEAILSDMSEALSEALASLQAPGRSDDRRLPAPPAASLLVHGRSAAAIGSSGRSVSRRSGRQRRSRADGSSRRIMLQFGDRGDSYTWRKYGQKDILGARFARNYYRCACAQRSGCSARKHVQQSDDDPTRLEITYIGAHTCDDRPSSPATSPVDDEQRSTVVSHLPAVAVAAAAPSTVRKLVERHVPASDMMEACTPSMEMEASWLLIPSPACSQSELLSEAVEVPELRPGASPPAPAERGKAWDGELLALYDSVVPDLVWRPSA
ncbi:transcription factor WRKY19-like [Oryza brachyantha]|uniref:transcription factor WRKY19-like n=1 Tax=Oryza brachyantha TaxID=4533 RepID=UPI001ADA520C|nr:transcription factor WRKY19-like [Oryza brachyantha]